MEDGGLVKEFLGDMPAVRFIAMYIFALGGMIMFFATDVRKSIKYDPTTPYTFSWKALFIKGALRIIGNLIFIAVGILFYGEISVLLFNAKEPLIIDGLSAVLLGTSADLYVTKFIGLRKNNH